MVPLASVWICFVRFSSVFLLWSSKSSNVQRTGTGDLDKPEANIQKAKDPKHKLNTICAIQTVIRLKMSLTQHQTSGSNHIKERNLSRTKQLI